MKTSKQTFRGFCLMLYFPIRRDSAEVLGAGSGGGGGVGGGGRFSPFILQHAAVSDSAVPTMFPPPESHVTAEAVILGGVLPPAAAVLAATRVGCNQVILGQVETAGASGCALIFLQLRPSIAAAAGSSSTPVPPPPPHTHIDA